MRYKVRFTENGVDKMRVFMADNPGSAFAKAQLAIPGATMIEAIAHSIRDDAFTVYPAPLSQRVIAPEPKPPGELSPEDHSCSMPFYDDVKGEKPLT